MAEHKRVRDANGDIWQLVDYDMFAVVDTVSGEIRRHGHDALFNPMDRLTVPASKEPNDRLVIVTLPCLRWLKIP